MIPQALAEYSLLFIIAIIWGSVALLSKLLSLRSKRLTVINARENSLEKKWKRLEKERLDLAKQYECLVILERENLLRAPWLAEMYADFLYTYDLRVSRELATKKRRAPKAADTVKEIAQEKREKEIELRTLRYQLGVYERIFPWLEDFREVNVNDTIDTVAVPDGDDGYDAVKQWISPAEFSSLTQVQKDQLILDRYRTSKRKTAWQVGIDFERYIGFLYEQSGCTVLYNGALAGLEDMGRDLVAKKGNTITVIQCKDWRKEKTIHEKHIFQLYGSMVLYRLRSEESRVIKGSFITTTTLSQTAADAAKHLGIEVIQHIEYDTSYPCIKCNINQSTGERIYHLPMDQMYDRVAIKPDLGECYAQTVQEAHALGFRRAKKWMGEVSKN